MLKILISVYIATILLIAGFAEASVTLPTVRTGSLNIDKVRITPKVLIPIADTRFDSRKEILTLSGRISSECLTSIQPEVQFDSRRNEALVSVYGQGVNCLAHTDSYYEVILDVKALFAQYAISEDTIVKLHIDNHIEGIFSFNYLAKKQLPYNFDTVAFGQVVIDHRTQKAYLVSDDTKIEIHSRFNIRNFENKYVQIKGLIPGAFSIGDEARPTTSQLIVGQLVALR